MNWSRYGALFGLLLASASGVPWQTCRADEGVRPIFIQNVIVVTNSEAPAGTDADVELFKHLLRMHGYRTNDCKDFTAALESVAVATEAAVRKLAADEELVAAEACVAPEGTQQYAAKLLMREDPLTNNRLATLHLVGIGLPSLEGGYAHKPGETVEWKDVLNRAIERTLNGYREATAVHVFAPDGAVVGERVHIDAAESWDPDGDSFELRWRVFTERCVGPGRQLPLDGRPCPAGTEKKRVKVLNQAGSSDETRTFQPRMLGDYTVEVHAKIGAREEEAAVSTIRVAPRRDHTVFVRTAALRLPRDFLRSSGEREGAVLLGVGYAHRLLSRIGLSGWREEAHLGVSIGSLQGTEDFGFTGAATQTLLGVDVFYRFMDRGGRFGLATPLTLSVGAGAMPRGEHERAEWGWVAEAMVAAYVPMGRNYVSERTSFCDWLCPAFTIGPTLWGLGNVSTGKTGLVGGGSAQVALEF